MTPDIEIARKAAAKAQSNAEVAKMILSGDYDAWPNVQGALNAVRMVSAQNEPKPQGVRHDA